MTLRPLTPGLLALAALTAHADENLFGWARSSETLPQGKWDMYNTLTHRRGVETGKYAVTDYELEVEYGATDALQLSAALEGSHYDFADNEFAAGLDTGYGQTREGAVFRGGSLVAKYNLQSPFSEPVGLAVRGAVGYTGFDEIGGIEQNESSARADFIVQKNMLDNTLVSTLNLATRMTTGKRPAEEYETELAFLALGGVAYRFTEGWYAGLEGRFISEHPRNEAGHFHSEHYVAYAGPVLHYGTLRYWVTLSLQYQVHGWGVDEPIDHRTYAEEQRYQARLKVGYNF